MWCSSMDGKMAVKLTLSQLIALSTRSSAPPFRFSALRGIYNVGELSAKTLIEQLEATQAFFFTTVRDVALLISAGSYANAQAQWPGSQPSKQTLEELAGILGSVGASLVYLSKDWRTVGMAGPIGGLAELKAVSIHDQTGFVSFLGAIS